MTSSVDALRQRVARYMSSSRYEHTLGVEKMAVRLGEVFMPQKIDELRIAALLHDVAKELSENEQLSVVRDYQVPVTDEDLVTLPALHSFAACGVIKRDFPEYSGAEILSAVYNHTLGAPDMSLFDKLIYISDYIEDGRKYYESACVRSYLLNALSDDRYPDKETCLNRAILMSIDNTIKHLSSLGRPINSKTLLTKSALEPLI